MSFRNQFHEGQRSVAADMMKARSSRSQAVETDSARSADSHVRKFKRFDSQGQVGPRFGLSAATALTLALGLLASFFGDGCRLLKGVASVPGDAVRAVTPGTKDKTVADPVEVQQQLLRFANEFSAGMIAVEKLRRGTNAIGPVEALK